MSLTMFVRPVSSPTPLTLERCRTWAEHALALSLGVTFLSAVASRFGLWSGRPWAEAFQGFVAYTGEVNAFMPSITIPWLAWSATAAETALGLALVAGARTPWVPCASAGLLTLFATAMAMSQGIKSPLDYSVFSAAAGALLLAVCRADRSRSTMAASSDR